MSLSRPASYRPTSFPQTPLSFLVRYALSSGGRWSELSSPSAAASSELGAPPAEPLGVRVAPLPAGVSSVTCAALKIEWTRSTGCAIEDHRLQVIAIDCD